MNVSFSGYEPPFDPAPMVRRMLDSVPRNDLTGLSAGVLSNASGRSGKRRKFRVTSRKRPAHEYGELSVHGASRRVYFDAPS